MTNFRQKWLVKKSKFVRKKTCPSKNILSLPLKFGIKNQIRFKKFAIQDWGELFLLVVCIVNRKV